MSSFIIRVTHHFQLRGHGMTRGQPILCERLSDEELEVEFPGSLGRLLGGPQILVRTLASAGDEVFVNREQMVVGMDFRCYFLLRTTNNAKYANGSYYLGLPGTGGNQSGGWGGRA